MGLSRKKVGIALLGILLLFFVIKLVFPGSPEAQPEPQNTGSGSVLPTPTQTVTPQPTDSPTGETTEEVVSPDASARLEGLSLEGEGFEAFEALPDEEVIQLSDTAVFGAQEYMSLTKGESPEDRAKRVKEYIYSKSKLFQDDIMASGLITTSHAVINNATIAGADATSAVYIVAMDISMQVIPSEGDPLPVVRTSRSAYHVLVEKTDEGWKITDIVEEI